MYQVHHWAGSLILILLLRLTSLKKHFNDTAEQGDHLISLALFLKANSEKESLEHSENILRNLLPVT